MAFLFLPAVHNSLFNQSKDTVAVANSIQRSGNNPSSTHKTSPVLDALCNSIVKFVILFQINRYFFYIACAVYWGIDVNFGQHMVCSWAFGVFISHYMKDLLMIPRLSKHKLSQEYCKRMWKNHNVNFDSCWDIPYEPIVSFTSAVSKERRSVHQRMVVRHAVRTRPYEIHLCAGIALLPVVLSRFVIALKQWRGNFCLLQNSTSWYGSQ